MIPCQIGDFGMARDIAGSGGGSDYYKSHGGIIPVKWTAPEVSYYWFMTITGSLFLSLDSR